MCKRLNVEYVCIVCNKKLSSRSVAWVYCDKTKKTAQPCHGVVDASHTDKTYCDQCFGGGNDED